MAWLEKRGESFHLCFRLGDEKFKKSLKTTEQCEADAAAINVRRSKKTKTGNHDELTKKEKSELAV